MTFDRRDCFDGEYWTNKGNNRFGELLMELRDEMRAKE
jgi:predicted NAD-dependent protein-ADP-ribosyltransferase YbiA (DUF1768 family)